VLYVNVSEAKARLTELLHRAEQGELVIVTRRNRPIVEFRLTTSAPKRPRPQFGRCAGLFEVPDDFDAPLPEEVLASFEGGE